MVAKCPRNVVYFENFKVLTSAGQFRIVILTTPTKNTIFCVAKVVSVAELIFRSGETF